MQKFKKVLRNIFAVILVVVLLYAGLVVWENRDTLPFFTDKEPVVTTQWLADEVAAISEFATLEYRYNNVSKYEDKLDFYGWRLPFTTKAFLIKYSGLMKFGIDGTKVDIQLQDRTIFITLPQIKVLSHEISEKEIEVYDQTKNIFNPIQIEDYTTFAMEQKALMEQKAWEDGLYQEAEKKAEEQIQNMLLHLPEIADGYTLSVSSTPPEKPVSVDTLETKQDIESSSDAEENRTKSTSEQSSRNE